MARMLYLRDIEVDVHVRCRACGHEGVLPRADMNRRFGPNYPVLSIAPHYRCSRCGSRDTESRPAAPLCATPVPAMATEEEAPSLAGPLAALQGLLDAVRSRGEPEEPEAEDAVPPAPAFAPAAVRAEEMEPDLELERLVADGGSPPESGRRPLWEPVSLADLAGPDLAAHDDEADKDWDEEDWGIQDRELPDEDEDVAPPQGPVARVGPPAVEDDPEDDASRSFDRTIAALRSILDGRGDGDRTEDSAPPHSPPPPAFSIRDDTDAPNDVDAPDDDADDDDADDGEPSNDDILSFAIRDPDKAPPPWERDPAPTGGEPLDRTIAALRSMVQKAAADRGGVEDGDDAPDDRIGDAEEDETRNSGGVVTPLFGRERKPVIQTGLDDTGLGDGPDEDDDDEPKAGAAGTSWDRGEEEDEAENSPIVRKSAQEQEMEEALRALRALVEAEGDLDDPPRPAWKSEAPARSATPEPLPGFKPLPYREPEPDDDGEPLDLVERIPADKADKPRPGEGKENGKKAAKDDSGTLGKTLAALRNMLELDGKQGG